MPRTITKPHDFPGAARYAAAPAIGDVQVYVETTTGRFCADAPGIGYLERTSHAALSKAISEFTPFDAILTQTSNWSAPTKPVKVRVTGYRKNPTSGGRWVYHEYYADGHLGSSSQTETDLIPWSEEEWSILQRQYAAYRAARDAYDAMVNARSKVPRPR